MFEKEERMPIKKWAEIVSTAEEIIENEQMLNERRLALYNKLVDGLNLCYKSLQTYGKHPLIDIQITNLLNKIREIELI